jgi:ABC-type transporter Mla subunit MlaD
MYLLAQGLSLPYVWLLFVLALAFVWLYCFKTYFPNIDKINKDIKEATALIPDYANADLTTEQNRSKQQEEFYEHFEALSADIGNIKSLSHAWHEFVESTYSPDGEHMVYVSHRPAHYFYRDAVLSTTINLSQFLAFPNYLIGMGLFFTFVGIAAALQVAQAGLSAQDGGQLAMQHLLAVASTKFISSLSGIFLSLVLSVLQRRKLRAFQIQLERFCEVLESCTQYKSTAQLLFESNEEQRRHTVALNDMATNIATGIGSVLSNQLPASVATALEPLAVEIRSLAQKFSSTNEDALQNVLQEFLGQMRKSTGDDMDGLMSSMQTLKSSLDQLVEKMRSMGENFGEETRSSSARLTSAMENFSASFVPVQQGLTHFGSTLSSLESLALKIDHASGNISGAADLSHESMSKLAGTVGDISGQIAPLQTVMLQMSEALAKMSGTAEQLQSAGHSISSAAQGFRVSSESIEQASDRIHQKVQVFEKVADGISSTVNTLERASGQVSAVAIPLGEASTGVSQALQQLHETEMRIQQNQQELKTILVELEKFSVLIPGLWSQYEGRFRQVDGDLAKAFNELTVQTEAFQSSVKTFVEGIDDKFTQALQGLSGAIQELTEEREQSFHPGPQLANVR